MIGHTNDSRPVMNFLFLKPKPAAPADRMDVVTEIGVVTVAVRRNSRARNYSLRISAPGRPPVLTLPARGSARAARDFLDRHAGWLARQIAKSPDIRPIADGWTIPIRGVEHLIRHRAGRRGTTTAIAGLAGHELHVFGDGPHLGRRVTDYLKREAKADLAPAVAGHARTLGVHVRAITVRDTKSRWGSCSHTGHLSFSWRLIMAPPHVLDYLAAHEVAHLVEMNHSSRYWRVVGSICPDYERSRSWLSTHGATLHAIGVAGHTIGP
jgi:predicted metal-dependent hydrolase